MSSHKLKRLKRRAKNASSILANAASSLHSRYNLRRIILEADEDGIRTDEELALIRRYLIKESQISTVPFWDCFDDEQQRRLCKLMNFQEVPKEGPPVRMKIDTRKASSALVILVHGHAKRFVPSHGRAMKLEPGDLCGRVFIPEHMKELLVLEKQQQLRQTWIEQRRARRLQGLVQQSQDGGGEPALDGGAPGSELGMLSADDQVRLDRYVQNLERKAPDFTEVSKLFEEEDGDAPEEDAIHDLTVLPGGSYLLIRTSDAMPFIETICERVTRLAALKQLGLKCMVGACQQQSFPSGTVLLEQGVDATKKVLVIVQGDCRLVLKGSPARSAVQLNSGFVAKMDLRQLAILGPQSIIGDIPTLLTAPQPGTIVTASPTVVLELDADRLLRELDARPQLAKLMRAHAQEKLRWVQQRHHSQDACFFIDDKEEALRLDNMETQSAFHGWVEVPAEKQSLGHDDITWWNTSRRRQRERRQFGAGTLQTYRPEEQAKPTHNESNMVKEHHTNWSRSASECSPHQVRGPDQPVAGDERALECLDDSMDYLDLYGTTFMRDMLMRQRQSLGRDARETQMPRDQSFRASGKAEVGVDGDSSSTQKKHILRASKSNVELAKQVDPLMPFPTLIQQRAMHSRHLPLLQHSNGYVDPWKVQEIQGALGRQKPKMEPKLKRGEVVAINGAIKTGMSALQARRHVAAL